MRHHAGIFTPPPSVGARHDGAALRRAAPGTREGVTLVRGEIRNKRADTDRRWVW